MALFERSKIKTVNSFNPIFSPSKMLSTHLCHMHLIYLHFSFFWTTNRLVGLPAFKKCSVQCQFFKLEYAPIYTVIKLNSYMEMEV